MGRGPYGDPIGSSAWDKQLASGGLLRGKLRCRKAMAERFRQAAEAPIPRTFVTDSLGCPASRDGDACPVLVGAWTRAKEGAKKNFSQARTEYCTLCRWIGGGMAGGQHC